MYNNLLNKRLERVAAEIPRVGPPDGSGSGTSFALNLQHGQDLGTEDCFQLLQVSLRQAQDMLLGRQRWDGGIFPSSFAQNLNLQTAYEIS